MAGSILLLDLNNPVFLDEFLALDKTELTRIAIAKDVARGSDVMSTVEK